MSYQIGIDTIHLKPTIRLGHTAYCYNDALKRVLAQGAGRGPDGRPLSFEDAWQMDLVLQTSDGPRLWSEVGRAAQSGRVDLANGHLDRRPSKPSPFIEPEQVLAFDAVKEYGLADLETLVGFYEEQHQRMRLAYPNQVVTGGYYKTLMSGATAAFGRDMLLAGAADPDGFERVLDSFFRLSMRHYQAWARTSIEVFVCHDELTWMADPIMPPEFYRRAVFPRYARLWAGLKAAGKKVLYCGGGDFTQFASDIAAAGADGFVFQPLVSLEHMVEHFGQSHVLVGGKVDCRTLVSGPPERIAYEVEQTLELARPCPGFIFAVGNHISGNVPKENALCYLDCLKQNWMR